MGSVSGYCGRRQQYRYVERCDLRPLSDGGIGGASDRFAGTFAATGGRHQELRGGRGEDSHNVLIRFLGLPTETVQDILGARMVDTDYKSAGATGKASYRVRETGTVTGFYLHNQQFNIRRYDRLFGGDGRNVAAFKPQILDFGYARYQDVIRDGIFVEDETWKLISDLMEELGVASQVGRP